MTPTDSGSKIAARILCLPIQRWNRALYVDIYISACLSPVSQHSPLNKRINPSQQSLDLARDKSCLIVITWTAAEETQEQGLDIGHGSLNLYFP